MDSVALFAPVAERPKACTGRVSLGGALVWSILVSAGCGGRPEPTAREGPTAAPAASLADGQLMALLAALESPQATRRQQAVHALARLRPPLARERVMHLATADPDASVRRAAQQALAEWPSPVSPPVAVP